MAPLRQRRRELRRHRDRDLQTYVVQLADVGQTLRVVVTATSPAGSGTATSAPTAVVEAIPNNDPLNPPTISGQPYHGQTLTADNGVWNPTPTSFGYQWRRCDDAGAGCADIGGSTSQTYVAQAADVGKTLRVVVTGTNANGSGNATSAQTSVISDAPSIDLGNPPSISGNAYSTQTLTASPGTWTGNPTSYAYQWWRCPAQPTSCTSPIQIAGATNQTYVVQAADVGFTLRILVTATNPSGSNSATSARTATVQGSPVNSALPAITGTATAGQTLSTSDGTWSPTPTSYTYQWRRCDAAGANCTDIAGATNSTYVVQNADTDSTLRAVVTAINPGGSASATSTQTAVVGAVPFIQPGFPPTICGDNVQGATLTANDGQWGGSPTSYGHQWRRCDAAGGTVRHRRRDRADVRHPGRRRRQIDPRRRLGHERHGHRHRHLRRGDGAGRLVRDAGAFAHRRAHSRRKYAAHDYVDASGPYTLGVGATVTKLIGYLSGGASPSQIRAVIYADSSGNPGALVATTDEVTVGAGAGAGWVDFPFAAPVDLNPGAYWIGYWLGTNSATLYYDNVTGSERFAQAAYASTGSAPAIFPTAGFGSSDTSYSLYASFQSSVVRSAPYIDPAGLPSISGLPYVDQTLTAQNGTWNQTPTQFDYQWRRCDNAGANCADIVGATNQTYVPTTANDLGFTLRVIVTATNDLGSGNATSDPTEVISGPPSIAPGSPPTISGDLLLGSTLTADPGTWDGNPTGYAYQWRRCSPGGGGACGSIGGETNQTYVVTPADVDFTLQVQVTATNPTGSALAFSAETAVIGAAPVNTALPTISGSAVEGQTLQQASNGTWDYSPTSYAYQWRRCDNAGANCVDIVGETNSSYVVQAADVAKTVRLAVSATNASGTGTASSDQTAVVHGIPVNTVLPSVSGNLYQGQQLTAVNGSWSESPSGYTYQWRRCDSGGANCVDRVGQTSSTYTLVAGDVDQTIRVVVTATNDVGSMSATSNATGAINGVPAIVPGIRADDLGQRGRDADPDRNARHLDRQPDELLVPVVPVQRPHLRKHQRGDELDLCRAERGCRLHPPSRSDRDQLGRLGHRDHGRHGGRTGDSDQHRAAGDHRAAVRRPAAPDLERHLERRHDRLRLPVAPLRRRRGELRRHRRCDEPDLHADRCGRGQDDPGHGDGVERGRHRTAGDVEPDRGRQRRAGGFGAAVDLRQRVRRPDADREQRHLERHPDLHLPVAPVRLRRGELQRHRPLHRPDLSGSGCRLGHDAAGRRHRHQRRRLRQRDLGPDRESSTPRRATRPCRPSRARRRRGNS